MSKKSVFAYGGPVFTWGSKAFDLMLVSIWWILGSLPIVTIGASAAAIYDAVSRSVVEDRESVTERFWATWKNSLKIGSLHGLSSFLLSALFLLNFGISSKLFHGHVQWLLCALYLVLFLAVMAVCCYLFPLISRYRMPFGWYLEPAVFCTYHYPLQTIAGIALLMAGYYAVYRFPLTVLLVPGFFTWFLNGLVEKKIRSFQGGQE